LSIIHAVTDDNLTHSQWRRRVLILAIPVIISNSSVPLVGIVDTAVMGRMGSPEWVAATAVGAIIFSSIYWVFGFLRMATGGLVAQAYGAHDNLSTTRTTLRSLFIAVVLGFVLIALQVPLLHLGLFAMAEGESWRALTAVYFKIRILSAPATLATYALLGALIGLQRMNQVLILQLLLNVLNIVFNIALFKFTTLGIAGVAIATVVSEYITVAVGLYIIRDQLLISLGDSSLYDWLFERTALLRYFRISGDLFIRTLCLTLSFYWMTVVSSRQGVVILAANTVLLHMVHFASHCMDGYAHAVESLTGYAIGKRSKKHLNGAILASFQLGIVTALSIGILYSLFGTTIINTMVPESATVQIAQQWLLWAILAPIVGIWSFVLDGIFIGATETASMRNSAILSAAVFLISISVLAPIYGNTGLWISYYILLLIRAVTLAAYWPRIRRAAEI